MITIASICGLICATAVFVVVAMMLITYFVFRICEILHGWRNNREIERQNALLATVVRYLSYEFPIVEDVCWYIKQDVKYDYSKPCESIHEFRDRMRARYCSEGHQPKAKESITAPK